MPVKIYHNPRCSKSRATLKLLQERGIEPEIVKYLETPPDASELADIIRMLGLSSARELMRKKEKEYKELGLDNPELSEEELIEAMVRHPRLIERPIVISNGKAAVGRPPENVLSIL
jgi:arsenate reductase